MVRSPPPLPIFPGPARRHRFQYRGYRQSSRSSSVTCNDKRHESNQPQQLRTLLRPAIPRYDLCHCEDWRSSMPRTHEFFLVFLTTATILPMPAAAYYTPLSDQAVREAYFLGKRGGESVARLLSDYTKFPAPSATGHHG